MQNRCGNQKVTFYNSFIYKDFKRVDFATKLEFYRNK